MPAMRRKDRRGPGITTRSTVAGADAVLAGDPVSGRAAGAAWTGLPEKMEAQTDRLTKVPAAATDERREDIIAEHLFKALVYCGSATDGWGCRTHESRMLYRLPGKSNQKLFAINLPTRRSVRPGTRLG